MFKQPNINWSENSFMKEIVYEKVSTVDQIDQALKNFTTALEVLIQHSLMIREWLVSTLWITTSTIYFCGNW